jgi:hypothetical protein
LGGAAAGFGAALMAGLAVALAGAFLATDFAGVVPDEDFAAISPSFRSIQSCV